MTQPPAAMANPWDNDPEVDPQGNPVAQSSTMPWEKDPEVPEEAPAAPTTESGYTHPMARFGSGAVRGFARAFNPVEIARSFKALGELGYAVNPATNLRAALSGEEPPIAGVVRGAAAAPGAIATRVTESPEGLGEVAGGGVAAAVTPGAAGGMAGKIADLARRSRVSNIVRAVKGGRDLAANLEKLPAAGIDAVQLPVSLTQGSLARKLAAREAIAGAEVGATKAALPGTVKSTEIAERLPELGFKIEDEIVTGARPLRRNVERTRDYYARMGEPAVPEQTVVSPIVDEFGAPIVRSIPAKPAKPLEIPRSLVAGVKEEAAGEAARGGYYAKRTLGQPVAPGAAASAEEATAARAAALNRTGLDPKDARKVIAYEKALAEDSLAKSLSEPATAEHLRRVAAESSGDWKAALAGRVSAPMLGAGGGALVGGAVGGLAASPLGALAGASAAAFMRSTPWQTLSAATKLKAIRALESGGVEAFREVVIPALIADTTRRRAAEQALRAQGEGVTAP